MIEPDPSAPVSAGEAPSDVPPAGSPAGEAADGTADGGLASFGYRDVPKAEKAGLVRDVFESVAPRYDLMNDLMSGGVHRLWKNALIDVVNPRPGEKLLDVAGGTGDIAFRLLKRVAEKGGEGAAADVTVCDINAAMLGVGRDRAINRGLLRGLTWTTGDAEKLPFPDRSFDAYTIAFGLRNVTDIDRALGEAYRVLKPGGRIYYDNFGLTTPEGWKLFQLTAKMDPAARPPNISKSSTAEELQWYAARAGFQNIRVRPGALFVTIIADKAGALSAQPPTVDHEHVAVDVV